MPVLSEVLHKLDNAEYVSTGNDDLNLAFAIAHNPSPGVSPGVPINTFTELSGPPGSGKAAIWLGLILDTLSKGLTVLYVGCNSVPFPYHRAMQLDGWNTATFKDRLTDVYASSIEQLLLIDQFYNISRYGLVVFSHYDNLVKTFWSRESRERVVPALIEKISSLRVSSTVMATAGAVKYTNEENVTLLAPATIEAKVLSNGVRFMVYKDPKGDCVLSTGERFRVARNGIVPATGAKADPVPLHILSPKLRRTPTHPSLNQPLTPTGNQHKRRLSVSTPSRQSKIGAYQQPSSSGPVALPLPCRDPDHGPSGPLTNSKR